MSGPRKAYKNIVVTNPVAVVPSQIPVTFLLMGITGTGKSSFIENLASDHELNISGNTYESVTKDLALYELVHRNPPMRSRRKIIFLDTPGLSDPAISERYIIKTIKEWMARNGISRIDRLLYFERINEARLPKSKRDSARIFKELAGKEASKSTCIITSMWDQLNSNRAKSDAETRFEELSKGHWKDIIQNGGKILRFENTPWSAMNIVTEALKMHTGMLDFSIDDSKTPMGQIVLECLTARLESLQMRAQEVKEMIVYERERPDDKEGSFLDFWLAEQEKVKADLGRFSKELEEFIKTNPEQLSGDKPTHDAPSGSGH